MSQNLILLVKYLLDQFGEDDFYFSYTYSSPKFIPPPPAISLFVNNYSDSVQMYNVYMALASARRYFQWKQAIIPVTIASFPRRIFAITFYSSPTHQTLNGEYTGVYNPNSENAESRPQFVWVSFAHTIIRKVNNRSGSLGRFRLFVPGASRILELALAVVSNWKL